MNWIRLPKLLKRVRLSNYTAECRSMTEMGRKNADGA